MLVIVSFSLPITVVVAVEGLMRWFGDAAGSGAGRWQSAVKTYHLVAGYLFGAALCQVLTDLAKFSVGRLRPNFLDLCRPNYDEIDCGTPMRPRYVTNFTCAGNPDVFDLADTEYYVNKARQSFVSGHASMSFQAMVFIVLYLQARVVNRDFPFVSLATPVLQLACVTFSAFTAMSRVVDNKHHGADVAAGALLGVVTQCLNVIYLMRLFREEAPAPKRNLSSYSNDSERFRHSTATQIDVVDNPC